MNKQPVVTDKTDIELIKAKITDLTSYKTYLEGEFRFVSEHMQEGYTKHEMIVLLRTNLTKVLEELEKLHTKLFLLGG